MAQGTVPVALPVTAVSVVARRRCSRPEPMCSAAGGGGCGGAGYGAGGGGPGGNFGGGGGGSSFATLSAITSSSAPSTRPLPADGQVTITYDPTADSCRRPVIVTPRFTG
jgi:hypothetical protein